MRRLLPFAVLSLLAACDRGAPEPQPAPAIATPTPEGTPSRTTSEAPILTAEGFGPVRIGMAEADARRALGPEAGGDAEGASACHHIWVGAEPDDVVYMIEDGRVSRITVASGGKAIRTGEGLGLGATEAAVRAAYSENLEVEPHKYVNAPAKYLTAWSVLSERGVRYETDVEGLVSEIHAGGPSIRYVEGCS